MIWYDIAHKYTKWIYSDLMKIIHAQEIGCKVVLISSEYVFFLNSMHLYIVRNHFTEVTHMTRAQGSSFIPGPRLIWTHPYTRQLTDRTENWKQCGQLIVVYRGGLD